MSRNSAIDCKPAKFLASFAVLFILIIQCGAQSHDQAGTDRKPTGKEGIIACRFSVLDMDVDIEVKDRRGNGVPSLTWENFSVYEDGVQQQILYFMQIAEKSSGRYVLRYTPRNVVFDGKRRKVRIEARMTNGRKLRVDSRLRPDPIKEPIFEVGVYPQGYFIRELPRNN